MVYKEAAAAHLGTLEAKENLVCYNGRYVYLKCVPCELAGHSAYAYIGLDIERKSLESQKLLRQAKDKNMGEGQVAGAMQRKGAFMLVASRRIAKDKLLPLYYTRQQVGQVFDVGKNYAGTTTGEGLKIKCAVDDADYKNGIKATKEQMAEVQLVPDKFHGEWNYKIHPRKMS